MFPRLIWILIAAVLPLAAQVTPEKKPAIPENLSIGTAEVSNDGEIRKRLEAIFEALGGYEDLRVDVRAGVVTLHGNVAAARAADEALDLARRTDGVVYVRNRLEQPADVESRLAPAIAKGRELLQAGIRKLPLIGIALLAAAICVAIGSWLGRHGGIFRRAGLSELATSLAQRIVRLGFIAIGVLLALEILDATAVASAFLGVAGVMGIAFGFAFRNIVENYLAGFILGMRNPFAPGDTIEIENHTGKVIRLTSRDTVLMTLDGNHLRIPNRNIMTSVLVNFSRNPRRRFDFAVGVSVIQDLAAVRDFGVRILREVPGVLAKPAPVGVVEELGESTVNLRFFAWFDQRESDLLKTKSEAIRLLKENFDRAGIEMPEPIYRVHMSEASQGPPPEDVAPAPLADEGLDPAVDTAADHTIDEQIASVERDTSERDLLQK